MHSTNYVDFGVATRVRGGEVLDCKVGDTITKLVVTHRDEACLIEVEGMADVKCCATSVAMFR